MNIRRPTLTFVLSYLFVATAALVLKAPAQHRAIAPSAGIEDHLAVDPTQVPRIRQATLVPTPGEPWPAGADPFAHLNQPTPANTHPSAGTVENQASTPGRPPRRPTASFTRGQHGETLADAAARIYGDPSYAEDLWLANRDSLPSRTAALDAGVFLRTPPIRTVRLK